MKFLLAVCATTLLLAGCSEEKVPEKAPKPVSTITLDTTKNYDSRTVSGIVQPADTTELSFEVSGKVEEVYFELGESFEKGDALAKLEQINYELAVKEREGQLSEARARLLETERDFKRKRDLVKDGAVSRSQFDISKSQYESAKDQVDIAKARLGMAREDFDDTVLIAPYVGTISARYIEPSQRITPNAPAFLIEGDQGLEVSVLAPEAIIKSLSIGKEARVNIPALNKGFNAAISEIGTAAEDANAFPVVLEVSSDDTRGLKTGMSAEATFKLGKDTNYENSFTLPVSAVIADENDSHFIYKVVMGSEDQEHDHVLERIAITVIEYFDQDVIVQGDIKEGDRVVDAGLAFLQDGQAVSPINGGVQRYNP